MENLINDVYFKMEAMSIIDDHREPTNKAPLLFFEYFFIRYGFFFFREQFFAVDEGSHYKVSIDRENELVVFVDYDFENAEFFSFTHHFKDILFAKLHFELSKTKTCIDNRIDILTTQPEVELFLKTLIYRTKYLFERLDEYDEAKKYDVCEKVLIRLIKFIFNRYGIYLEDHKNEVFFKDKLDITWSTDEENKQTQVLAMISLNSHQVTSFKWINNDTTQILKLYNALIEKNFISNDTPEKIFLKAFDGKSLTKPLNIRWSKFVNGKLSKVLVFFFIDELNNAKLIEFVARQPVLYKKILATFVDQDGKQLENLKVTNASSKKTRKRLYTQEEQELKSIIGSILN
jgi:hypothetical protein